MSIQIKSTERRITIDEYRMFRPPSFHASVRNVLFVHCIWLSLLVKPRLVRLTVHFVHKREYSLLHRQNIKMTLTEKELLRVKRKIRTKTIFNYMAYVRCTHPTHTHTHTHVNGSNSHRERPVGRQCVVDVDAIT